MSRLERMPALNPALRASLKPPHLTEASYHSRAARRFWLSSSDIKAAHRCEAAWLADYLGKAPRPKSDAFDFGHLFEAALTMTRGELDRYLTEHPELLSTRGASKGQLKAEYATALDMATAVRRSPYLRGVIKRSAKQVILTGSVCGVPVRVMMDLLDKDGSIYDIKSTRDFKPLYDAAREEWMEWWAYWYYPMQLYVYREIARQNGIDVPRVGLIAASKSDCDVQAITFGEDVLAAAKADTEYTLTRIKAIADGEEPDECGCCKYCISHKKIDSFKEI